MLFFGLALSVEERPDALYESCIHRIAGGDKDALGILYENMKDAVYGFALSIVQNTQEAEDVLQDTFVSIYFSARGYQGMGKPMAWVLTITKNLSLMKIRTKQKAADVAEDEWSLFIADTAQITSEDKQVLIAALKTITPAESQIVMLHAVAGFKHREIAEILGMPLSTVLSRYSRAIRKLRSVMEETGTRAESRC